MSESVRPVWIETWRGAKGRVIPAPSSEQSRLQTTSESLRSYHQPPRRELNDHAQFGTIDVSEHEQVQVRDPTAVEKMREFSVRFIGEVSPMRERGHDRYEIAARGCVDLQASMPTSC